MKKLRELGLSEAQGKQIALLAAFGLAMLVSFALRKYVPATGEAHAPLSFCRDFANRDAAGHVRCDENGGGTRLSGWPVTLVGLKVDLNRATAEDLEPIPAIGPALSRRIIEHREVRGPYASVEELIHVRGIGPKLLSKLKKYVEVPN